MRNHLALIALLLGAAGCATFSAGRRVRTADASSKIYIDFCGGSRRSNPEIGHLAEPGDESDLCIKVTNWTTSPVGVSRGQIAIQTTGIEPRYCQDDGRRDLFKVAPGNEQKIMLSFETQTIDKGDEVTLSFGQAITVDGHTAQVPPLLLVYR